MAPHGLDSNESELLRQEFEEAKRQVATKPDLIKELLADLEIAAGESRPFSIDSFFSDRISGTEHRLEQVRKELESRLTLHTEFIAEIETQLHYTEHSLERFTGWGVGYNTGVDVKRNHLERQLQQLRTERRATELRAWDDMVRLREQLRQAMLEYRGAERLAGALAGSATQERDANQGRTDPR